jgi:rhodanese-related sulfurtransferase
MDGQARLASAKQIRKILQKFQPFLQLLKKNRKIILVLYRGTCASRAAWQKTTAPTGRRRTSWPPC